MDLLEEEERSLLETAAVFDDGWTIEAAAAVAGLDEDRALELTEALARHSLIYLDSTGLGLGRGCWRPSARSSPSGWPPAPTPPRSKRRHADYYCALAGQAERPLRRAGWREWAGRLQAEAGNLGAAVRWYLAHDRARLPHMFRALLPLWVVQNDTLDEVCSWVAQLLPDVDTLEPQARAELLWTGGGDRPGGGRRRNGGGGPRAPGPAAGDRSRTPTCTPCAQLAVALDLAIVGDLEGALQEAAASLDQLRSQDEPLWTTAALLSASAPWRRRRAATTMRLQPPERGPRPGRAIRQRPAHHRLPGAARHPGRHARDRPGTPGSLLDRALDLSLAIHSTRNLALCLAAYAQLAFDGGDAGRAALLPGAAEGLRQRAGLRAWPAAAAGARPAASQVRETLGADRFDQEFAAGARLSQRAAAAAAHG